MTGWLAIWRTPRCFFNSWIDIADDSRFGPTSQSRVNQQNTCAIPPFDLGVDLVLSKRPKRYMGLSGLGKEFPDFNLKWGNWSQKWAPASGNYTGIAHASGSAFGSPR